MMVKGVQRHICRHKLCAFVPCHAMMESCPQTQIKPSWFCMEVCGLPFILIDWMMDGQRDVPSGPDMIIPLEPLLPACVVVPARSGVAAAAGA